MTTHGLFTPPLAVRDAGGGYTPLRQIPCKRNPKGQDMVTLGIILVIIGFVVESLRILLTIGVILLVIGLVLNFVPIGGSRRRVF